MFSFRGHLKYGIYLRVFVYELVRPPFKFELERLASRSSRRVREGQPLPSTTTLKSRRFSGLNELLKQNC
jgi:hypothetical protein